MECAVELLRSPIAHFLLRMGKIRTTSAARKKIACSELGELYA